MTKCWMVNIKITRLTFYEWKIDYKQSLSIPMMDKRTQILFFKILYNAVNAECITTLYVLVVNIWYLWLYMIVHLVLTYCYTVTLGVKYRRI